MNTAKDELCCNCPYFCWLVRSLPAFYGKWSCQANGQAVVHEDQTDRIPGDVQGDFSGVPLNDAARMYAESYDVRVCSWSISASRSTHFSRADKSQVPRPGRIIAYNQFLGTYQQFAKSGWTGNRIHPAHVFMGFSTAMAPRCFNSNDNHNQKGVL